MAAQLIATNGFAARGLQRVDRAGQQLLAGAALAEQQHRGRRGRHLLDDAADAHLVADRDDAVERHAPWLAGRPGSALQRVDVKARSTSSRSTSLSTGFW